MVISEHEVPFLNIIAVELRKTIEIHVLPPVGNDTANAHRFSKWKPINNLILPNENSWNLSSKSILSFFHMALVSHHKIQFKKSKPVEIGESRSKYAIIYSKFTIFSWKRQQADMFLTTFVDHAIHCWNPQVV